MDGRRGLEPVYVPVGATKGAREWGRGLGIRLQAEGGPEWHREAESFEDIFWGLPDRLHLLDGWDIKRAAPVKLATHADAFGDGVRFVSGSMPVGAYGLAPARRLTAGTIVTYLWLRGSCGPVPPQGYLVLDPPRRPEALPMKIFFRGAPLIGQIY
jgi:hypothetical protein